MGPDNKDFSILGSIVGSPILGNYQMQRAESLGLGGAFGYATYLDQEYAVDDPSKK